MSKVTELQEQIESLPYGDPEHDHLILDRTSYNTLKLVEKLFSDDDRYDDLHFLVTSVIRKWDSIEELWYS